MKVTMIGGGSWGTSLSFVLAMNGHEVYLHTKNPQVEKDINEYHKNTLYLPGIFLPETISATSNFETALKDSEFIVLAPPSHAFRETLIHMKPFMKRKTPVVHASKGLEKNTFKRLSEVIYEETKHLDCPIGVLSGPSHAEEVAKKLPTTIVSASEDEKIRLLTQKLFMNGFLRVYTNDDVIGVELGGSLKNIIALAAGFSDGLGFGDNAKAALLTRGLAEIKRFAVTLGAKEQTFNGLAGVGDLIVTATSIHSRNYRMGNLLTKGLSLEEASNRLGMVAEGVKATKIVYEYAKTLKIDLPLTESLYSVLFENKKPDDAIKELMNRKEKFEWD